MVALARRTFPRRCQPQLLVPTRRFHEVSGARRRSVPKLRKLKRCRPKRNIAAWIFVFVLVLLVVVWVVEQVNRHSQLSAQSASQQRPPQLHKQSTGNVAFTMTAGGASNYKFTVPAGASNVTMKGHFAATGGFGNDIEVFVCAEDGYVNWQNGHGTKTFYNSGHVTQDSVNISLPSDPATYYVVFNNKAAFLTPRAVEASIDLNYYSR